MNSVWVLLSVNMKKAGEQIGNLAKNLMEQKEYLIKQKITFFSLIGHDLRSCSTCEIYRDLLG